ncbi:carbohydrate-binding protein [Fulvivirga sp. M361]|uniref:beta-1,3-glucanase family protein n=1 Tax=Fulvivirga sp. M361 TaxID=2594266 RepID=UPI00117ABC6E|nr:beta-1,3-glucanase family protein [Fulvivirga sp. M361]TRX45871.1 carbohydrate-binding protein [Fulvivirga sp. M361]
MKRKFQIKVVKVLFSWLTLLLGFTVHAQTLPYEITNTSEYSDNEVFVTAVGEIEGGHVWVDVVTGQVNRMDPSYNTVQGPVIGGNQGPGQNGKYANCFRRLSDIPNKTIQMPKIEGCRIMISFKSQLFLYFFGHSGDPKGYAAPNLANPTDPNQGIKFELVELTFNNIGLWMNTSRVDSYQYPMGLEVWGNGFYKKVGELKKHSEILAQWQATAPNDFKGLLNPSEGIIHFPTKVDAFPKTFMDGYINSIWSKYSSQELAFTSDAGVWRGRVQSGNAFVFRRDSDGQVATISGKPTTLEAMEGSGIMASGGRWDKVVQAQMVAAITRHAVDLNIPSGVLQNFGDASKYYQTWPYNWYSKFFHQTDISFESQTYTFAYDDVYDQSSTIHTTSPERVKITIGGITGNSNPDPTTGEVTLYLDCPYAGTSVGLSEGRYTTAQLNALGMPDKSVSSLRIQAGYEATLYSSDNFGGATLVKTSDDDCLTNDGDWNDKMSSIIVSKINDNGPGQLIEAEDYNDMLGVQKENCSEGGQNVGYIDTGDWMAYYEINFPTSGAYLIEYRVASNVNGARLSADLNAGNIVLGEVSVPNTGGWQNWTTVSHTVNITAGTYQFGLFAASGGWNVNWIKISKATTVAMAMVDNVNRSHKIATNTLYPNPVKNTLFFNMDMSGAWVSVVNSKGFVSRHKVSNTGVNVSAFEPGIYTVIIEKEGRRTVQRFVKK